jgi:hypothetical protein
MSPLFSGKSYIDRETILDVTVNVIPVGILVFFVGLFLIANPWGLDPFVLALAHGLILFPGLLLLLLTYVSARAISRDEAVGVDARE